MGNGQGFKLLEDFFIEKFIKQLFSMFYTK